MNPTSGLLGDDPGATVVITHRVKEGGREQYERWLERITPVCKSFPGHIDWQIIRPVAGLTSTYTFIIRFASRAHLEGWLQSPQRRALINDVQSILVRDDDFFIRSGLDFWFTPEGAHAQVPVRWKQFVITWSAIFPMALFVPMAVLPLWQRLGLPDWRPLTTLVISAVMVLLMTYVVMPRYTKLMKHWLFR